MRRGLKLNQSTRKEDVISDSQALVCLAEMQVKNDTPPTILIHSDDDSGVLVENSVNYYLALRKHKIPAALHVWEDGGHGFGLATNRGSVKDWPYICKNWMIQRKLIN